MGGKKQTYLAVMILLSILVGAIFLHNVRNMMEDPGLVQESQERSASSDPVQGDEHSSLPDEEEEASTPKTDGTGEAVAPKGAESEKASATTPQQPEKSQEETSPAQAEQKGGKAPSNPPAKEPKTLSCTLTIDCKTILNNREKLVKGKEAIVPADGILLSLSDLSFEEGDSVFDLLRRELKDRNLHLEFSKTVSGSVYIEGICNLYEFDCGELSGWQYAVNGVFASGPCSDYLLQDGDAIHWVYTCDLGKDVGNSIP